MKRIAVLLSDKGTGSNLAAILNAIDAGTIKNGKIIVVVSNKRDAYGLIRAKKKNIPTVVMDLDEFKRQGNTRIDYDRVLGKLLREQYKIDLVVLAGWMLILSDEFIKYFPDKTINLHPALLPDAGDTYITLSDGSKIPTIRGLHTNDAVQYAINNKYPATGSTVHFITEKVDCGPVITRSEVKIKKGDTVKSLYERIKIEEHKILPYAINLFCNNRLRIIKRRVKIV